jgi:calcineurin-like phosphoesterase family protein
MLDVEKQEKFIMSDIEKQEKAWEYYEKIKKALDGLFEILTLNFDQDNMYYQCGVDNLIGIKESLMDLLKNNYCPKEIRTKLREIEFDMKKCLFFENPEKQDSKKKQEHKTNQ